MAVSLKSLGIDRLGVEELWDSIAAEGTAVPLTPAQRSVLERRVADHLSSPDDVVAWEEVKASLDDQLKG